MTEGSFAGRALARILALLVALASALMPARARADEAAFAGQAAALIAPYLESGLFSGAILVAKDGKPLFRRAYGLADREWTTPNTLDTHFRIGSLSKGFTAAAILQLAERGKLSLDDRIRTFVPDAPASWEHVTLRHLLAHTSGIINYTALPDYYARLSRLDLSPREIVALTTSEPLLFEPGARFEYTNTGYVLLGMAVEAVSGVPYARYLRENLLAPLGLRDTDYDDASLILPRRASGYRFGQARWRNAPPMASGIAYAAGGLYSTVDDLLAWERGLFGGQVLSKASLAEMVDDHGRGYGLGWYVGKAHKRTIWSHGGALPGFLSILDVYPDEGLTVIVLANNENAPALKIARSLAALRFGTREALDAIVLEDLILDRYAGTYRLGPRVFLTLSRGRGRLLVQGTGQPAVPFLPESDRTFVSPAADTRITLDTEPDGRPNGLVHHQAGRDRIAPRIDPQEAARILAEPPPVRREIALDPAQLAGLAGRYGLAPGLALTVTVEAGLLYAQASGQPRHRLFRESGQSFFLKAADAQITFETDADGRARRLVLHQNGLETPADRIEGDEAKAMPPSPHR